jgi:hypothetical protein
MKLFKEIKERIMKKILALLMVFVMVLSFVACGEKQVAEAETSQDLFDKVMENQETQNAEFDASFEMTMTGLEEMGLAGPMTLQVSGKVQDEKSMEMELAVDPGQGMQIQASIFMKDGKMLVHAPMMQMFLGYAYIEMDIDAMAAEASVTATTDPQKVIDLLNRFSDETDYSIYDILTLSETMETAEVIVNEETLETTKLVMDINVEKAPDLLLAFMDWILNDDEAKEVFFANYTEEDLKMMEEEMNDPSTRAEIEEALEMIDIQKMNIVYYINADYIPVKTEVDMAMTVNDGTQVMDITLMGTTNIFNIDGVTSVEYPEVDPAEIMDMNNLLPTMQ